MDRHGKRARGFAFPPLARRRVAGCTSARRHLALEPLESRRLLTLGSSLPPTATHGGEGEASDAAVTFYLQTSDAGGTPISRAGIGDIVFLDVFVQDTRLSPPKPGVYAAYLDVLYDGDLLSLLPDDENPLGYHVVFSANYPNGKFGEEATAGILDEIGAFQQGYAPLGAGRLLVFRVAFESGDITPVGDSFQVAEDSLDVLLDVLANDQLQTGVARFAGEPADVKPEHAVLWFDPPDIVPDVQLQFFGTDLQVTAGGRRDKIQSVTQPDHGGHVAITPDGLYLQYTPAANYWGLEQFTYSVVGGPETSVTIDVQPVNDPPLAADDAYTVGHNQSLHVLATEGVLANDYDLELDQMSARLVTLPAHGTLTLHDDGGFEYVPHADYRGLDQFTYRAFDGQLESTIATAHLEIGPPLVSIRLELVDANGTPMTQIADGTAVALRGWIQDLRNPAGYIPGVQAAFLDVLYDDNVWSPIYDAMLPLGFVVEFGPGLQNPGFGNADTAGVIDELGSTYAQPGGSGSGEELLFQLPLESAGPRTVADAFLVSYQSPANRLDVLTNDQQLTWDSSLLADPADELPDSAVLLYDPPQPVTLEDVRYRSALAEMHNDPELVILAVTPPDQGGTVTISADARTLIYSPADGFQGAETFQYTVLNSRGQTAKAAVTVQVEPSWQNLRNPLDVNADLVVTALDALVVVNELSRHGAHPLDAPPSGPPYLDVDGDGYVRPRDVLLIINYLSRFPIGEGEPADVAPRGAGEPGDTAAAPPSPTAALPVAANEEAASARLRKIDFLCSASHTHRRTDEPLHAEPQSPRRF